MQFIIQKVEIIEKWEIGEDPHHLNTPIVTFLFKFKLYMPRFLTYKAEL